MSDTVKVELDNYELGIIVNALNELRTKQIKEEQPTEPINELLLKMINEYESFKKKGSFCKDAGER